MGGGEAFVMILLVGTSVCCPLILFLGLFGVMLGFPLLYGKKIDGWTEGATPAEAYERLGEGATTSAFMVRPASFMVEGERRSTATPEQVVAQSVSLFSAGWGRAVHHQDATGMVGEMRFLKFLATDLGWVAAVVVQPSPDGGSVVRYRFRTTYMWPVITFFLTLRLNMHIIPHLVP
jgi:hypothetical protein